MMQQNFQGGEMVGDLRNVASGENGAENDGGWSVVSSNVPDVDGDSAECIDGHFEWSLRSWEKLKRKQIRGCRVKRKGKSKKKRKGGRKRKERYKSRLKYLAWADKKVEREVTAGLKIWEKHLDKCKEEAEKGFSDRVMHEEGIQDKEKDFEKMFVWIGDTGASSHMSHVW